jgi:hypothetical protein
MVREIGDRIAPTARPVSPSVPLGEAAACIDASRRELTARRLVVADRLARKALDLLRRHGDVDSAGAPAT